MLFPPVPQPLNLKMEIDGFHPGLHIGNIQRNDFKTPNPDCIRDHPVKLLWPGLSTKSDYPLQRPFGPGFLIAWGTESKQKGGICKAEMDEAAQNSPREQCELRILTLMR